MSFVRKIKRGDKTYLAEVENQWIDGRCVQKHIRYIGKEVDEKVIFASSISNLEVTEIKLFGPLLVLDSLAKEIDHRSDAWRIWKRNPVDGVCALPRFQKRQ